VTIRVVVTGLGTVSGLGASVELLWQRALRGERALRDLQLFSTATHRTSLAAEVAAETPMPAWPGLDWRQLGRAERFAVAATIEATAVLPVGRLQHDRAGRNDAWRDFFGDLLVERIEQLLQRLGLFQLSHITRAERLVAHFRQQLRPLRWLGCQ